MGSRAILLVTALLLLAPGCFRNSKAPEVGERFVLEYAPPVTATAERKPVAEALRVGRFSADPALETTQMAYRPSLFREETDYYNRWIVSPEALVSGFLLRDIRQGGVFLAAFSDGEPQAARFLLRGHLEAFEERDDGKGRTASLAATVTLLDLSKKEIPERLLFQKSYRFEEPLSEIGGRGLAQAMSRAMEKFSARVIEDSYLAASRL